MIDLRRVYHSLSAAGERYAKIDPEEKTKEAFRMFNRDGIGKVRQRTLAEEQ